MIRLLQISLAAALVAAAVANPRFAAPSGGDAAAQAMTLGPSGLPLPRFVSLKSSRVNARIGPGLNYGVEWMYLKSGLPMEIIQEYDNWRRVRDADGAEGWINQALLSGRRTGIAAPWQNGGMHGSSCCRSRAGMAAWSLVNRAVGSIVQCNGEWCQMSFDGHQGWMKQAMVWAPIPAKPSRSRPSDGATAR